MASSESDAEVIEQTANNAGNDTNASALSSTSVEISSSSANENGQILRINNKPILIKIAEINSNITFPWKIQAIISCEYPKRTFNNTHGSGEISNWDLIDDSNSITLVAFNLNSYFMSNKLKKDKAYEFTNLSIRPVSDMYKTLPHPFQILCTNATRVEEINLAFDHRHVAFNFTHLNQIDTLPLYSIIDVQVHVMRDFGISTGTTNDNIWHRRDIHVDQDGVQIRITLWNNQARLITPNMAGLQIKLKHVKISWFDGSRFLATIGNTELSTV